MFWLHRHFQLNKYVPISVIVTVRTNPIQNHVSVVVCQTPRSVSSILAGRRRPWTISPCASIWSPMNMNSSVLRRWKPDVSAVTSTSSRIAARISSTSAWGSIPSMSSESTRCCRVLELIGNESLVLLL